MAMIKDMSTTELQRVLRNTERLVGSESDSTQLLQRIVDARLKQEACQSRGAGR